MTMNYHLESTNKRIYFEPSTGPLDINPYGEIYYPSIDFTRKFIRYDFADEWNNLGYGKILIDGSKWSISKNDVDESIFTEVLAYIHGNSKKIVYCGIIEKDGMATIWFNRQVGPQDGIDIWILEDFLANYKTEQFGSVPIISEIPYGYDGAVTMRLDCDEEISTARELFELYKEHNIPFSLAIKTSLDLNGEHKQLIHDVIKSRGAIVSHSHNHLENWGGSKESAYKDISKSISELKKVLPKDYTYNYVVSPFHQNSLDAIKGLEKYGIKGFIGGIIKNDPDFLKGRATKIENLDIFTHSQQCMLHGDCYRKSNLEIYKESFNNHLKTHTFFGYLDHPFSNYKYGWKDEHERLNAHDEFLKMIKSNEKIWYANLIEAMEFLLKQIKGTKTNEEFLISMNK